MRIRWGWGLVVVGILGGLFVSGQESATSRRRLTSGMAARSTQVTTPIDPIAVGYPLRPRYYYHFAKGVTPNMQDVFTQAAQVFNRTGLVTLIAGQPSTRENGITCYTYSGESRQTNRVELGSGGPTVTHQWGWPSTTVNRGKAGINLAHPERGYYLSVAVHELGHALGLAHSDQRSSVMYPLDQGRPQLSAADQLALRQLYFPASR